MAEIKKIKLLVRRNLKMTDNKLAAQCVHAAIGLYKKDPQDHWKCVVLDASDKKFDEAKEKHPEAYVVTDAGYTEVPAGSETVLAWWERDEERSTPPEDAETAAHRVWCKNPPNCPGNCYEI